MNQTQTPIEEEHPISQPGLDDFFFHAADFIYRRRKAFIILGVLVLAAIVLTYAGFQIKAKQDLARAESLYQFQKSMREADFLERKGAGLNAFIQENQGTKEGYTALLQRSAIYYQKGDLLKTEHDLLNLTQQLSPESGLYPLAVLFLSNILRDQGKATEAISILVEAKSKRDSDVILVELAETYFDLKNYQEAKSVLLQLQGEHPDSLFLERAKRLSDSM